MTTSIKAPEELAMTSKSLSLEIETQGVASLFLQVPVGDAAGNLMTAKQFDEESKWTIGWPDAKASVGTGGQDQRDDEQADDEDVEPDARLGAKKREPQNLGEVEIRRRRQSTAEKFKILIERFGPPQRSETIELKLLDNGRKQLDAATIKVRDAEPKIAKFESDRYIFKSGAVRAAVSWTIDPAGRYRLRRVGETEPVDTDQGRPGKGGNKRVNKDGTYQLEVMAGDRVTDTRSITLYSFDSTRLSSTELGGEGSPTCGEILGIYRHKDTLYAAVRRIAAGNTGSEGREIAAQDTAASIWCSDGRFTREHWVPMPISIPADAASRPGAVFADNLYFMGGSSYDPDRPGSRTSYFNFEQQTWVGQDPETAWPREITARMGHALLASPDDSRLWLIGGYNGDGGALNDIWVYGKTTRKWTPIETPDWEPRCLFGVAFCGTTLFIAGGFDSPGGYPTYDDIRYCDTSQEKYVWKKLDKPLVQDPNPQRKQYRGCALTSRGNEVYVFVSYGVLGDPNGYDKVFKIFRSGEEWDITGIGEDVSRAWVFHDDVDVLDYYRFDATTFAGCIFVRRLAPAARKDTNLHYLMPF